MQGDKIKTFMTLAGQKIAPELRSGTKDERMLGARLLLSEVLEYVIKGLGVTPVVEGQAITKPDALTYTCNGTEPHYVEMLDGLCDVAYTMYWNAHAFGVPLEEGFDLVCDNNLEKFVKLNSWKESARVLEREEWHCGQGITWPSEVAGVEVLKVGVEFFAVGKDAHGKVRKPSSYKSVDLRALVGK